MMDRKPLVAQFLEPWTSKQSSHLSYIAEFTVDIQHVFRQEQFEPYTLSHPPPAGHSTAGKWSTWVKELFGPPVPSTTTAMALVSGMAASGVVLDYQLIAEIQQLCADTQKSSLVVHRCDVSRGLSFRQTTENHFLLPSIVWPTLEPER
jgi:hypothetical protein